MICPIADHPTRLNNKRRTILRERTKKPRIIDKKLHRSCWKHNTQSGRNRKCDGWKKGSSRVRLQLAKKHMKESEQGSKDLLLSQRWKLNSLSCNVKHCQSETGQSSSPVYQHPYGEAMWWQPHTTMQCFSAAGIGTLREPMTFDWAMNHTLTCWAYRWILDTSHCWSPGANKICFFILCLHKNDFNEDVEIVWEIVRNVYLCLCVCVAYLIIERDPRDQLHCTLRAASSHFVCLAATVWASCLASECSVKTGQLAICHCFSKKAFIQCTIKMFTSYNALIQNNGRFVICINTHWPLAICEPHESSIRGRRWKQQCHPNVFSICTLQLS